MTESTVVSLPQHGGVEDPLTEVLRASARELVRRAVEAEVAALLAAYDDGRTESGRRRVVRHGHGPERAILTGIGPVVVRRPKVRDRGGTGEDLSARCLGSGAGGGGSKGGVTSPRQLQCGQIGHAGPRTLVVISAPQRRRRRVARGRRRASAAYRETACQ